MVSCLLIGPASSGKSALIKRLQEFSEDPKSGNVRKIPTTQPTVGINMTKVGFGKNRNREVTLREIGGAMTPLWPSYFAESKCILFVIDSSNQQQASAASIQLSELLSSPKLSGSCRIAVVLNKSDATSRTDRAACMHILRLHDFLRCSNHETFLLETSAFDGSGIDQLYKWLDESTLPNK